MDRRRAFLVAALLIASAGAARAEAEQDLARGAARLAPFKTQLQHALQKGLADGPAAAIAVCRVEAPRIAASLSREGIRMGRTSHKLRNPANAGPAWARPLLDDYLADPARRTPRVVSLGHDRLGYVEPILVQAPCLLCHGETLAPEVARTLAELYPSDRATGFREGDLRGIFWVEFPERP